MGLMYLMPVKEDETDHSYVKEGELLLRSYGLPIVFWGYLTAILLAIGFMFLAAKGPIFKLMATEDPINKYMAIAVLLTIVITPITLISFFFYEKNFYKKGNQLTIIHKLYGLPVKSKRLVIKDGENGLEIRHHLDSPNMARINQEPELKGFENRGFFELYAITEKSEIMIDRCSQKNDLKRLRELLLKF